MTIILARNFSTATRQTRKKITPQFAQFGGAGRGGVPVRLHRPVRGIRLGLDLPRLPKTINAICLSPAIVLSLKSLTTMGTRRHGRKTFHSTTLHQQLRLSEPDHGPGAQVYRQDVPQKGNVPGKFEKFILAAAKESPTKQIVILIDEYDEPRFSSRRESSRADAARIRPQLAIRHANPLAGADSVGYFEL